MSGLDAAIIAGFILYAVWSGFRSRDRASKNLEEYFLAGRSLPGWKAGLSMAATQFAADTPLLVTGLIATAGIFSLWRLWSYGLAFLLLGFVLARGWRRALVLTDAELTEVRYGGPWAAVLRAVKAIYFGTIFNCTVLAMVLFAAGAVAEPFLLWDQWLPGHIYNGLRYGVEWVGVPFANPAGDSDEMWVRSTNNLISILSIVSVTTLYSTTGGLRSVVNTDVAQFFLMMAGTTAYAAVVLWEVGGLSALSARIEAALPPDGAGLSANELLAFTPDHAQEAGWAVLAVYGLQWLVQMNADGTGYLAQRSMACRSDRDARVAAIVFCFAQVLFRSLLWLPIGLGLIVLFPPDSSLSGDLLRADREATFVRGMKALLPPGLSGLMLTGMLAALASTVDTHLNWGSSYWTNDIYKRFVAPHLLRREPKPRELVWVARGANVLILVLGLAIMTQLRSIQTAWQVSLLLGAGMGVPLVLRWLWWRITARGELAAVATSTVVAPVLLFGVETDAVRLLAMAVAATGGCIAVSFAFGPESATTLHTFYQRAQPFGAWRPFRSQDEQTRKTRELRTAVVGLLGSMVTVFALLVGVGTLIVSSPPPLWLPSRGLFGGVLIAVGVGAIPLWWGAHRRLGNEG